MDTAPGKEILMRDGRHQRLLHYRRYLPSHFVGMPVWRDFGRHGVYKGRIEEYDDNEDNDGQYVWRVHYDQDGKDE